MINNSTMIQEFKGALHGLLIPLAILIAEGGMELVTPARGILPMLYIGFAGMVYLFHPGKRHARHVYEVSAGMFMVLLTILLALDLPDWWHLVAPAFGGGAQ